MHDYVDEVVADWAAAKPGLDVAPLEVVSRLLRAANIIQEKLDGALRDTVLSHKGDLDTLAALRRSGRPLTPSVLATMTRLTSGGMTNRLDRLEQAGLVERNPDAHDRRSVTISLTADGASAVDAAFAASVQQQGELISGLTAGDQAALARQLRKLLVSLGDEPVDTATG